MLLRDRERKYRATKLAAYAQFRHDESDDEVVAPLKLDAPLLHQLRALQPMGYLVPGVPIVHVVVAGSAYEKTYFTPKRLKP